MHIEFSPLAISDLQDIADFIAQDSPVNASNFANRLLDRCLQIGQAPEGYIERPEVGKNIRSVAFQRYMIFYSFTDNLIRVERILHGSRDYLSNDFM